MTKGQFIRLFLSDDNSAVPVYVIAGAKQLTLHVSCNVESASTKDTDSDFEINEVTGINYDIRTSALVRSGDEITTLVEGEDLDDIETIYQNGTPVRWQIANVSGDNNRTKGSIIASGSALITNLTINSPNRQVATYDAQFVGVGDYTVGS